MNIDMAERLLNRIAEELPAEFYKELNGGILLLPDSRINPQVPGGRVYIMGEYVRSSSMGRYINIYYGSIAKVYGSLPENKLEEVLREVLYHEFTHHVESLAGERGLEKKDAEQMQRYLNGGA